MRKEKSERMKNDHRGKPTAGPSPDSILPPVHKKPEPSYTYDRLDRLWDRYPRYHEMEVFSTMEALLEEHESWKEDFEGLEEEYRAGQYDRFLVQLSWSDLAYRQATRRLIEAAEKKAIGADGSGQTELLAIDADESGDAELQTTDADESGQTEPQTSGRNRSEAAELGTAGEKAGSEKNVLPRSNPCVEAFMKQFADLDTDRQACFLFPESFVSQFFVIAEVCKRAEEFRPVKSLFPDEETVHYLAVFDKRNMDDVLLMFHLLYTNASREVFGGYSLYDYPLIWYQTHLQEQGVVLRSPYLPDRIAKYLGNIPYCHNPAKTVYVRRNIAHMLECGYFSSELEMFLCLTRVIMPLFQWWYTDIALYEEKDGYRTAWRLERTKIRTRLTAEGVIRPKWKHELSLFHAVRKRYPDTLYQYRPDWLGRQSLDLYIPSLQTAIEYQGVQHYVPVDFFGGEQALAQRQELDRQKKQSCLENRIRLIEWPYSLEPTDKNVREMIE